MMWSHHVLCIVHFHNVRALLEHFGFLVSFCLVRTCTYHAKFKYIFLNIFFSESLEKKNESLFFAAVQEGCIRSCFEKNTILKHRSMIMHGLM